MNKDGMEELIIHKYQIDDILDAFRKVKNAYREGKAETNLDRSIAISEKHLNEAIHTPLYREDPK